MSEVICRNLRIRGRVQGVGYRWSLCAEADRLALAGWVRNRRDGSVEALVAGPDEAVAAFTSACRRGPRGAAVTDVTESPAGEETIPGGFRVLPTA